MSGFIKTDRLGEVMKAISEIAKQEVLVGIPDSAPDRTDTPISGAQIGYIMEHGSPAGNIPARPFLVPGVASAKDDIAAQLGNAAKEALDGSKSKAIGRLKAAGLIGQNAARLKINSNISPALKPSTIASRFRARETAGLRKGEEKYAALVESGAQAAGMSPAEMQSEAGIVSLVNTGQLRNSITYVLRKK